MDQRTENTGPTLKQRALRYAQHGYQVIPLHTPLEDGTCSCGSPDCGSVGKHPRTPQGLKNASIDPDDMERWWNYWPDANIGIVTGSGSGIIAIDVDEGGEETLQKLQEQHEPLPGTITARTGGGGKHIYFKHPGGKIGNRAKFAPGLDVRGDGGYVVAPPSLHKSGKHYQWKGGASDPKHLAECPNWLLKLIKERPKPQAQPKEQKNNNANSGSPGLGGGVLEGKRNDTLFRQTCAYRRRGFTPAEAAILIKDQNELCQPPLPESEINQILESAYSYVDGDRKAGNFPESIKAADAIFFVRESEHAAMLEAFLRPGSTVAVIPAKLPSNMGRLFIEKEVVFVNDFDDDDDQVTAELMRVMLDNAKSVKQVSLPFGNSFLDRWQRLQDGIKSDQPKKAQLKLSLMSTHYYSWIAVAPDLVMRRLPRALNSIIRHFRDFYDLEDLPDRRPLIKPWLDEADIVLLSAPSGAGKTWFAMEAAACLDKGRPGMGGLWIPEGVAPVLYVDGEMHWEDIRNRGAMLGLSQTSILSKAELEYRDVEPPLNIANAEVRKLLQKAALDRNCKLVISDNLFSLVTGLDHNQSSDWETINHWLLRLRSKGVSTILVHHTGKGGDQLGTSSREFNVNLSLKLEPHRNVGGNESVAFTIAIKKQRSMGLELSNRLFSCEDGKWTISEIQQAEDSKDDPKLKVAELLCEGRANKDIAGELGLSASRISQIKGKLLKDGYLEEIKGLSGVEYSFTNKGEQWALENRPLSYTQPNQCEGEEQTV